MNKETLIDLQSAELEILSTIDSFCKEYNIIYSLYGGTAIGAIRHKGFIPWDDDIDIAMTRGEYNRFCNQWKKTPIKGYYLETVLTDPYCGICHAKVRKEGTILLSKGEIESVGHHGIWVDIFPFDKVTKENQKTVISDARKLIILSRANVDNTNDGFKKKAVRYLTRLIYPDKRRWIEISKCVDAFNENDQYVEDHFVWKDLAATYMFKYSYPRRITKKVIPVQFEGQEFSIYSGYDEMLRIFYGDYMQLPPEEERVCKHNPVKVKF